MRAPFRSPGWIPLAALALAAGLAAPVVRAEDPLRLTLAQAIRTAWEQGPGLEGERRAVKEAELQLQGSGAPYRPGAGLSAGYDLSETTDGSLTLRLSLEQTFALRPLLGGDPPPKVREARAALEQARRRLEATRQDVARSVLDAYLDLLEARQNVERQRAAVATAQSLLEQTELRARQMTASEADLYQARADLLAARQGLAQAELEATRSLTALNRLLGLPLRTPLDLAEPELPADPPGEPALQVLIAHARARRLDLIEAREGLAAAREALGELKAPFEPTLSLTARYVGEDGSLETTIPLDTWEAQVRGQAQLYTSGRTAAPPSPDRPPSTGWSAGLGLSLPLLDGGSRRNAREVQALQVEVLEARVRELEAGADEEVRQALESYLLAREAVPVRRLQLQAARARLEAQEKRFEAGVITPRDLADARNAYETALVHDLSAAFQVLRAAATLQRAAGLPVAGEDGTWLGLGEVLAREPDTVGSAAPTRGDDAR